MFVKGRSGNPKGRPVGAPGEARKAAVALIDPQKQIAALIKLANDPETERKLVIDIRKYLTDKCVPSVKSIEMDVASSTGIVVNIVKPDGV